MNNKQLALWFLIIAATAGFLTYVAFRYKNKNKKELYKTVPIQKKDITHIIRSTGAIEAKDTIRVGSLINGVVKDLYVEENDKVKKGQQIALLDNGKGDTDVKIALGALNRAKAALTYQERFIKRQKKLYEKQHISLDELQNSESVYEQAKATVEEAKGTYEKASIDYNNINIISPVDGVVLKKNVSLGEGISSFLNPTVLYTIAKDLTKMKVELEIDESTVGQIKIGDKARLTFDTYPNKIFGGTIHDISNGPTIAKGTVSYKAYIYIDNKKLLLRPGMTVNAAIKVAEKENVLSVPGYVFSINPDLIEAIAKSKNYGFKQVTEKQLEQFKKTKKDKENPVKTIWIVQNSTFIEKPVEIGITDNILFEIVSGLEGNENILIDIEETDVMKQMFKRLFSSGIKK